MADFSLSVSKGWIAQNLGKFFDRDYYFNPAVRHEIDLRIVQYVQKELCDLNACFTESNLGRREYINSNQVLVGGIQPNMILGMLLGAEFVPEIDKDADISPQCFAGRPFEELPEVESLLEHPLVCLFSDQIKAILDEGRLEPIPPFFWDNSRRAAVHGSLTTAQKLLGASVFMDLVSDLNGVKRFLRWVSQANAALVRHFAKVAGIDEVSMIHVGECAGCMVGARQFEELVVPEASLLGQTIAPVRFHSCGKSDHLLKACTKIENLASLDLGGETSIGLVREIFGDNFPVSIAPPVTLLSTGNVKPLLDWAAQVIEENGGGPLTVVCHLEPQYDLSMIRVLADYMQPSSSQTT